MTRDVKRGGDEASAALRSSFVGAAKGIAAAFSIAAVGNFLRESIDAATALEATVIRTNVVFGRSSDEMEAWAETSVDSFGLSKRAALDASSGFGNMFNQMGVGRGESVAMSQQLVELAGDMALFFRTDITGILESQSAAFRGEYDSLQRYLPAITAAAIEQRALANSGKRTTKELTIQDKTLATHQMIVEGATAAEGYFADNQDTLAGQQMKLTGQWENAKAELGEGLMPVMVQFMGFLIDTAIPAFRDLFTLSGDAGTFFSKIREFITDVAGHVIGALQAVLRGVANIADFLSFDEVAADLRGAADAADWVRDRLHASTTELQAWDGIVSATEQSTRDLSDELKRSTAMLGGQTGAVGANASALEDRAKIVRTAAAAGRDLRGAERDLAELLAEGAVNDKDVADAREALADATKDLSRANRDLAKTQREYDEALAVANILGTDTALEELADASDNLADAQENVVDAAEREREAAEELRVAQAGDPEFQDKLADARDKVADATDKLAEAQDKVTAASAPMLTALENTYASLERIGVKAEDVAATLATLTGFETYVNMSAAPAAPAPVAGPTVPAPRHGPLYTHEEGSSVRQPVTVNITQTDPEPDHVARAILWRVI